MTTYTLTRRSTCQGCGHDVVHVGRRQWMDRENRVRCIMAADDAHRPAREWFRAVQHRSA